MSVSPGFFLTLDKNMVNSLHHNLIGKIKIICKPRPIRNEIKNMADGLSNVMLNMELSESKDLMKNKVNVQEYGEQQLLLQSVLPGLVMGGVGEL